MFSKFEQQGRKKIMERNKKERNWQPWTLIYTLVFQTMSFPLNIFYLFKPIGFPSKMVPCKLNHHLICLDPRPLFKGLGTNLKFLTNRNVRFHWTLLLRPLTKVAFKRP